MITAQQVQHIARLARLGFTEKEIEKYRKELSLILDYAAKLNEIDVAKIALKSQQGLANDFFRQDKEKKEDIERVNKLVEAAPEKKEGYVKVRAVL